MKNFCLFVLIAALLSGCSGLVDELLPGFAEDAESDIYDEFQDPVRATEEVTLYNSVIGVSYTVPKSWWIWYQDQANLNEDPELTNSLDNLSIQKDVNSIWVDLLDIGNNDDPSSYNHFSMAAYADQYVPDIPVEESAQMLIEYFEENEQIKILETGQKTIGGIDYHTLSYAMEEDDYTFCSEFYFVKHNGFIITTYFGYWEDFENSGEMITNYLTNHFKLLD